MRNILLWVTLGGLTACFPTQQAQDMQIIYVDGCAFMVEGLTLEQIKQKTKAWEFDENCRISVSTTVD